MFLELLNKMPLAYDMGIDIRTIRKRKKRKGSNRKYMNKEVVQMTSKEIAQLSGEILEKVMRRILI